MRNYIINKNVNIWIIIFKINCINKKIIFYWIALDTCNEIIKFIIKIFLIRWYYDLYYYYYILDYIIYYLYIRLYYDLSLVEVELKSKTFELIKIYFFFHENNTLIIVDILL